MDYHGAYRPVGLNRKYPNVINYEGIHGLEQMKWAPKDKDMAKNDVACFFLRLTAGPMDYTPGAMLNHPFGKYTSGEGARTPGSVGTRCHQMAMMSLYEGYLQMLCDSPTNYEKNEECFRFMAAVPTVWDDTVGLGGCPGAEGEGRQLVRGRSLHEGAARDCLRHRVPQGRRVVCGDIPRRGRFRRRAYALRARDEDGEGRRQDVGQDVGRRRLRREVHAPLRRRWADGLVA